MAGEIALDTSIAIRCLNNDPAIVEKVFSLPNIALPLPAVAELLFGAANSARASQNLVYYLEFIEACLVLSMGRETARFYAKTCLSLRQRGRPIPENDVWIAELANQEMALLLTRNREFGFASWKFKRTAIAQRLTHNACSLKPYILIPYPLLTIHET